MKLNHDCPNCHIIHEQNCVPSNDGLHDKICEKCNSKQYTLGWLDSYNTFNWRDKNIPIDEDIDKENGVLAVSGVKNLKEQFAIYEIENYDDGWIDCYHEIKFEANNIDEVKEKVREIIYNNGRIVETFSVYKNKEIILTEEDF